MSHAYWLPHLDALLPVIVVAGLLLIGSLACWRWATVSREARSRASTQYLQEALDSLGSDAEGALLSLDGRLLLLTPAAVRAWEVDPVSALGRPFGDLAYWSEPAESRHQVNRALLRAESGRDQRLTVPLHLAEGVRQVELTLRGLKDLDGRRSYLLCSAAIAAAAVEPGTHRAGIEELLTLLPATRDLEEAAHVTRSCLQRLFPGTTGVLYLNDAGGSGWSPELHWGSLEIPPKPLTAGDCWGLRRNQQHRVEDASSGLCCAHHAGGDGTICQPLYARGVLAGLLSLEGSASPEDAEVLARLAEPLALTWTQLRAEDHLREQALRDSLTGLLNRRAMDESIGKALARARGQGRPLSLLLFDVDHFKQFNDHHGHDAGDLVLKSIGQRLMQSLRGNDRAFRYGGEELLVLLPDSEAAEAERCAERLRAAISALSLIHRGERLPRITASVGVAEFPRDGEDAEALIAFADRGLYAAKAAGRDRVIRVSA